MTAVVATAALAGCSAEEPTPDTTPTASVAAPSSTTTEEPGLVEPTLPAAAKKNGKAGAEAFVEYYWAVVDYAQATGDTSLLRELHLDVCKGCEGGVAWIEDTYDKGGRITGGRHDPTRVAVFESAASAKSWTAVTTVDVSRQRSHDPNGTDSVYPSGQRKYVFTLGFASGTWTVSSLDVE